MFDNLFELITKIRFSNNSFEFINLKIVLFYELIVCWAQKYLLKPKPVGRGFKLLPRGSAGVNAPEVHI